MMDSGNTPQPTAHELRLSRHDVIHVLQSLSELKRREALPRSKLQELKDMLIARHPTLVTMVHEATRANQSLTEQLLSFAMHGPGAVPSSVPTSDRHITIDALDVSILRAQFGMDESAAIRVLEECRGDFVDAILAVDARLNADV